MERIEEAREKARRNLTIANHLLTQSYPLFGEPKLLFAVLQNIFLSLTNAITAILNHEFENKNIQTFPDTIEAKVDVFKREVAPRYRIPIEQLQTIDNVKAIITSYKESSVSFTRKDAFVICEEGYHLRTLTFQDMKALLAKTKTFIQQMEKILTIENKPIMA